MVHYLFGLQNGKNPITNPRGVTSWEDCVNDFDVEKFVKGVRESGAGYVLFTLCQASAKICMPCHILDEMTEGKCAESISVRDLPMEIGLELQKYGIDLYLYFTGDGPRNDEFASRVFGTLNHTGDRVTEDFVKKWSGVMEEIAVHYGSLVKGWWIDGAFDYIGYTDELLKYYKDAALKGNPEAVITFNNGVVRLDFNDPEVIALSDGERNMGCAIDVINKKALEGNDSARRIIAKYDTPKKYRYSIHDDFTAGESSRFDEIPVGATVDGECLWHITSFLGKSYCEPLVGIECGWCGAGCRYTGEYLRDYTERVTSVGGAITFDVCVDRFGKIDEDQLSALMQIKK